MGPREADGGAEPKLDSRERFSGAAGGYARSRPGYPDALVDWVVAEAQLAPDDLVLDLGCGTGILTRKLAHRGLNVLGLDPNEDMLAQARAAGGESIDYRHVRPKSDDFGQVLDAGASRFFRCIKTTLILSKIRGRQQFHRH